jgi:hypothetical protein
LTLFGRLGRVPTFLVPIITPLLLTTAGSFSRLDCALIALLQIGDLLEIKEDRQAFMIDKDIFK